MDICKLPKNVIERIFNKLNYHDLLNTSLVCKKFNKIISDSCEILNKFEIVITDYENREWIGTRKYQKIYIEDCREDHFLEHEQVFETLSDSVAEIAIRNLYEVDLNNLVTFFDRFENLTKLSIFSIDIYNDSVCSSLTVSPPSFKFLNYLNFSQCNVILLNLFINCKLKYLKVSDDYGGKAAITDFLVQQSDLETLELSYFEGASNIFSNENILNCRFRLKRLVIDEDEISSFDLEILRKFLDIHEATLECFEVYEANFKLLKYLKNFSNLQILRIFGGSDSINIKIPQMPNIKVLYLESKIIDFPSFFPNVISLKTNTHFIDFSKIGKLKKLEHLEVNNFWDIPIFLNKNIRSIKLVDCTFQNVRNFNYQYNKLEMLTITSCYSIEWLKDFLLHDDQNLKYLEMSKMEIKSDQITQELINVVNNAKYKIHTVITSFCD